MSLRDVQVWTPDGGELHRRGYSDPLDMPGFELVVNEQWPDVDPDVWTIYDNSTFGAPTRIQTYMAANVEAGTASDGAA